MFKKSAVQVLGGGYYEGIQNPKKSTTMRCIFGHKTSSPNFLLPMKELLRGDYLESSSVLRNFFSSEKLATGVKRWVEIFRMRYRERVLVAFSAPDVILAMKELLRVR